MVFVWHLFAEKYIKFYKTTKMLVDLYRIINLLRYKFSSHKKEWSLWSLKQHAT